MTTPTHYKSRPRQTDSMPGGIPYIISNEAAERFSYYGMKAILYVFMTKYMMDSSGALDTMSEEEAKSYYHLFSAAVYFFPVLGAVLADVFLGKYKTILWLSIVYCLGHFALALDETRFGLAIGLTLIAIGSGGIKPCVSAHVGDQFGKMNSHLLEKVYMWFYFSINVGASLSAFAIPLILQHFGPQLAFGLPGLLMLLATFAFWMGRNKFVHIPPKGVVVFKEAFSKEGLATIGKLGSIYIFIAVFWALFDQTGSSWIQQAEKMDLYFMGRQWLPSQVQSINGILILVYIPLFSKVIYPKINQYLNFSPLRKIGTGLFITVISFLVPAFVQTQIEAGITPSIAWHILAFAILTAGEVLVSITTLEFSYTQASNSLKSVVMALFLLSVSIGNLFTSAVNFILINPDGSTKLTGTEYFLFFSGLMLIVSFLYIPVAMAFKVQNHVQDEEENRPG